MSSKKTKENIFLNENRRTFKCVGKLISPVRPALVALSAQPQPHAVQSKINTKKKGFFFFKEAFHMLLQSFQSLKASLSDCRDFELRAAVLLCHSHVFARGLPQFNSRGLQLQ